MSKRLARLGAIAYAVHLGEQEGISTGHTLLQKLIYFLQRAKGVDLGYRYKMYHYGPYCGDVWADLNYLEDVKAVAIEANASGFGYRIYPDEDIHAVLHFVDEETKGKVSELLQFLGNRSVRELECLATTHYVYQELRTEQEPDLQMIVERVRALKPHLTKEEVQNAIESLKEHNLL
ncbi:MAG: hypothetical protein H0Z39_11840 [Peptococcaceae bacterium]|nr:hypothetical protein [Peptococcaceae bacterium]